LSCNFYDLSKKACTHTYYEVFNTLILFWLANDSRINLNLEKEAITASLFKFTKELVDASKQKPTSSEVLNQTLKTSKVLARRIWRTTCMPRGLVDDQEVRLYIYTNQWTIWAQECSLGRDMIFFPTCIAKAGDVKIVEMLETI